MLAFQEVRPSAHPPYFSEVRHALPLPLAWRCAVASWQRERECQAPEVYGGGALIHTALPTAGASPLCGYAAV